MSERKPLDKAFRAAAKRKGFRPDSPLYKRYVTCYKKKKDGTANGKR